MEAISEHVLDLAVSQSSMGLPRPALRLAEKF
jgi:hypothetical protein